MLVLFSPDVTDRFLDNVLVFWRGMLSQSGSLSVDQKVPASRSYCLMLASFWLEPGDAGESA